MKKSELQKIIREEISKTLNEFSDWRRFLDPYTYIKSKEAFKYRNLKVSMEKIDKLIAKTEKLGDYVVKGDNYIFAYSDDSLKKNHEVWHYWVKNKELYYGTAYKDIVEQVNENTINEGTWALNKSAIKKI